MSYSGTVRCSYCHQKGHNKRSCPELSRQIEERYHGNVRAAAVERKKGNESDAQWYDGRAEKYRQQYIKRTKFDLATGEKVSNKAAKAERMKKVTCGYCGQRGHTRRTCDQVKRDKQVFIEQTRRVRKARLQEIREIGIGVGSLLPVTSWGYGGKDGQYGHHTTLRYIKSVDWNDVCAARSAVTVHHVPVGKLASPNPARWTSIDNLLTLHQKLPQDASVSLVSNFEPPAGWLDADPATVSEVLKTEFSSTGDNKERSWMFKWPEGETAAVIRDLGLEEHYPHMS